MLDRLFLGSSAGPNDPNFNNVTLLLHGDGSNGAQNNTFLDSSTNNFTITRNGNTTQGSFSPYGSNWSNYFDGSGDYLTAPYSVANSEWWTQDFTIEMWVYNNTNAVSGTSALCLQLAHGIPTSTDTYWAFGTNASGQVDFFYFNGGNVRLTGTTAAALNTWNHIAMVYTNSTGNISLYLNGSRVATGTKSGTPQNSSGSTINVGGVQSTYYNGYVSNLRILDGTALYSGTTYTVPTAPLTAITNTSLLTCQSNRFRDASTNNFTITRNGDVKVTNFAPFAPSAAYSTTTNGGSAYFDGTGDYLQTPSDTAFTFSGSLTIEFWINFSSTPSNYVALIAGTTANTQLFITTKIDGTGLRFGLSGVAEYATGSQTWVAGAWYHVALVRNGTDVRFYVNGVNVTDGTATNSTSYSGAFLLGGNVSGAADFPGYISNLRIVKGTAVYTAAFTPPTTPLTAITNTSLLLNFTNAAIFDNSMKNNLETVGNAQISTSVKKFGTGSMAFDGTGDGLLGTNSLVGYTAGNFTWECWVNFTSTSGNPCLIATTSGAERDILYFNSSTGITYVINRGGSDQVTISQGATTGWSTGTWYHVAVVRNSNTYTIYRDGTSVATGTSAYAKSNLNAPITLGYSNYSASYLYLNGYIDDARITNGVARYTANFTPPTAAFPNK